MAAFLQTALIAGTALFALAALWLAMARSPTFTIILTLLCTLLGTPNLGFHPGIQIGNINIYPSDLLCLLLATMAIKNLPSKSSWPIGDICMIMLTTLVLLGTVLWIFQFDLKQGVNHWRYEIYFMTIYWWASTRPMKLDRMTYAFKVVAVMAIAIQVIIGVKTGFGSASTGHFEVSLGSWVDGRPINSESTFIILIAFFLALAARQPWTLPRVTFLVVCSVSLLISQQRSVWVSGIIGIVYIFLVDSWRRDWGRRALVPFVVVMALLIPVLYTVFTANSSLVDSATSTHTLDARVGFWTDRLSFNLSPIQWLFGESFGPTPVSLADGWEFQIQAHNMYVQFLNQNGALGAFLLLIVLVAQLRQSFRLSNPAQSSSLISIGTYGLFFVFPQYSALLLVPCVEDHDGDFSDVASMPDISTNHPSKRPNEVFR